MNEQHEKLTYTQKIALTAGSLSALYLFPSIGQAAIIHVDNNPLTRSLGDPINVGVDWDVDGANGRDFILAVGSNGSIYLDSNASVTNSGDDVPLNGQGMVRQTPAGGNDVVQNLPLNFFVGPTLAAGYAFGPAGQTYRTILGSSGSLGVDVAGFIFGDNYIGFRFDGGSMTTLYGWARINVTSTSVTIAEWAYENSGAGLNVGATSSATAVPEPSTHSLALLGLGAAGVAAWRRRKAQGLAA